MNFVEVEQDGIKYAIDTDAGIAIVISVDKRLQRIHVPAVIDDYPVRAIGHAAFRGNNKLKTIYLPDTIWSVRESAFNNCVNLEKVHFYNTNSDVNTVSFGHFSFQQCKKLECITFDKEEIVNLGQYAFDGCNRLVKIEAAIHRMQEFALNNCELLEEIVLDDGVNWTCDTFKGCKKLKQFVFLGEVHSCVTNRALKKLRGKNIVCSSNSPLVNLAFEGVKITTK